MLGQSDPIKLYICSTFIRKILNVKNMIYKKLKF